MITGINHIGLRVKSFTISLAFYQQLGFELSAGPGGPEPVAILTHPSGVVINLILNSHQQNPHNMLMEEPTKYAGYTHVAYEVSNIDDTLKMLNERGIELSGEPMKHPTGTSMFIRDPDKNVIEFIEYNHF